MELSGHLFTQRKLTMIDISVLQRLARQCVSESDNSERATYEFDIHALEQFVYAILRKNALDELTAESQRMGMYDNSENPLIKKVSK